MLLLPLNYRLVYHQNQRVLKSRKPIINLDLRNSPPALSYLSTGRCKVHLICDTFIRVHLPSLHPITSCEKFLFFFCSVFVLSKSNFFHFVFFFLVDLRRRVHCFVLLHFFVFLRSFQFLGLFFPFFPLHQPKHTQITIRCRCVHQQESQLLPFLVADVTHT